MTDSAKPEFTFDMEIYKNYLAAQFLNIASGKVYVFEAFKERSLNTEAIRKIINGARIITFNGNNFDLPLLWAAVLETEAGVISDIPLKIKSLSDKIIVHKKHWWWDLKLERPKCEHVDLLAYGRGKLKLLGGRIGSQKLQDLPFDPSKTITEEDAQVLRDYCVNDLRLTADLYRFMQPAVQLREEMSDRYGINLLSSSDAQIAEIIVVQSVKEAMRNAHRTQN